MSSRPLLVLDLDETLWHGTKTASGVSFQLRPGMSEFLYGVAEHYDLAVWTSATADWMQAGLQVIRAETGYDLASHAVFLWERSRCTFRRSEDGLGFEWRKPARKLRAGWLRVRYTRERILAVDDTPAKWACGYGHLVRVSSWSGAADDNELPRLNVYLASIAERADLMALEKRGWRSAVSDTVA